MRYAAAYAPQNGRSKGGNIMSKPKISITLVDRKGDHPCHRGHQIGDSYDFDTERGQLCPMAMHVAFPYIDILRYGGQLPEGTTDEFRFCCPDADVINIFELKVEK